MMSDTINTHCGFVALVGRPNVGKSTLLNAIIGQKISITSKKPQTTRQRVRGIKTTAALQMVFVDTPGMHLKARHQLNHSMNNAAVRALSDIDVVVFVIEALQWRAEEDFVLEKIRQNGNKPVILVINKVDQVKNKEELLPFITACNQRHAFTEVVPVSAERQIGLETLESVIARHLPASPFLYPAEQITDNPKAFFCCEVIREKLTRLLGQELPYAVNVELQSWETKNKLEHISIVIWVAKENQKAIVIGDQGEKIKQVGSAARRDLEKWLGCAVYLNLWVKVKNNWFDDQKSLQKFGYTD